MKAVAYFHSPLRSKFGTPRQSGVISDLPGKIIFEKPYRSVDAVRGMEGFDYLWLIWQFSENEEKEASLTVRPPRLGGNKRVGVFASRSPYRPNQLGLSSVQIERIDYDCPEAPVIYVKGGDLIDGTPIYDVKPYIPYTDAHPNARAGFTDATPWKALDIETTEDVDETLNKPEYATLKSQFDICKKLLAEDPRPHYHTSDSRIYNMQYDGFEIFFKVSGNKLMIIKIS